METYTTDCIHYQVCSPSCTNRCQLYEKARPQVIYCHECKYQIMVWHKDKRCKQGGYLIYGCKLAPDSFTNHPVWGEPDQYCSSAEKRDGD